MHRLLRGVGAHGFDTVALIAADVHARVHLTDLLPVNGDRATALIATRDAGQQILGRGAPHSLGRAETSIAVEPLFDRGPELVVNDRGVS